jgi:hypothetical protein
MYSNPEHLTIWSTAKSIYSKGGITAFWTGLTPRMTRIIGGYSCAQTPALRCWDTRGLSLSGNDLLVASSVAATLCDPCLYAHITAPVSSCLGAHTLNNTHHSLVRC